MLSPGLRALGAAIIVLLLAGVASPVHGLAGAAPTGRLPGSGWVWPIASPHPVVRPFIAPETPYAPGHRGIDIAATAGAPVLSPSDGVVHFSGFVVDRDVISIDHGGGVISSFEPVSSNLIEGSLVTRGDAIGTLEPGHCRQPCLHMGVRVGGQYVSPLNFLGGLAPSVLLPTRELP